MNVFTVFVLLFFIYVRRYSLAYGIRHMAHVSQYSTMGKIRSFVRSKKERKKKTVSWGAIDLK